jgi:hypothetical protein
MYSMQAKQLKPERQKGREEIEGLSHRKFSDERSCLLTQDARCCLTMLVKA